MTAIERLYFLARTEPATQEEIDAALREAKANALDVDAMAEVLAKHGRNEQKSYSPRVVCICGWVGDFTDEATHVAAALHVALVGEKP